LKPFWDATEMGPTRGGSSQDPPFEGLNLQAASGQRR
jgi:hypothetical protein